MFTTMSKSENSNRCGVSASRSLGPISGSASIIEKTASIAWRSSLADSNEAPTAYELPVEAGVFGVGDDGAAGFGASAAAAGFGGDGAGFGGVAAAGFFT